MVVLQAKKLSRDGKTSLVCYNFAPVIPLGGSLRDCVNAFNMMSATVLVRVGL